MGTGKFHPRKYTRNSRHAPDLHDWSWTDDGKEAVYRIFEGKDHFNNKPLYQVIGVNNDYGGEFHTSKASAQRELKATMVESRKNPKSRKRKNPGCRDARGFVATPECRGQQQAILLFFHEMKRSDPKFTLKDAWEISKGKKPVTKLSKKTLAKAKRDAPVAEQTVLAFNPRKRKNPGKFFVVVDTSVPGGKWVRSASGSTIHTKATLRQADRQAESLERTTGRPHQVIDAEWYGPAREVLIKTGMIGKTNPSKRKNARKEINAYAKRYTPSPRSAKNTGARDTKTFLLQYGGSFGMTSSTHL